MPDQPVVTLDEAALLIGRLMLENAMLRKQLAAAQAGAPDRGEARATE